jgi:hypothetical protein
MQTESEKAYYLAMTSLKKRDYEKALDNFKKAESGYGTNSDFSLLYETTRLLVAVKTELCMTNPAAPGEKKEMIING